MQKVVFNGNYFLYFDVTIAEYWRAIGFAYPQAIVDALLTAETVTGFAGHTRYALADLAPDWRELIQ